MPSGPREQAEASESEAEAGLGGESSGSKIKLESRAADLKKLLLGKRQKATQTTGSRSSDTQRLSPATVAAQLAAGPAASSAFAHQVFSDSDIGDLIADLMPPHPNSTSRTKTRKATIAAETSKLQGPAVSVKSSPAAVQILPGPGQPSSTRTVSASTMDTEIIVQMKEPVTRAATNAANKEANEKSGAVIAHKSSSSKNNNKNKPFVDTSASTIGSVDIQHTSTEITMSSMADADTGVANQNAKDLQDWLLFTNYYDVAYRNQFLARRRRLAALEAERQLLLEEEKEEATMTVQRQFTPAPMLGYAGIGTSQGQHGNSPFAAPAATATSIATTESTNATTTATVPVVEAVSTPTLPVNNPDPVQQTDIQAKRAREANVPANEVVSGRPGKVARVETNRAEQDLTDKMNRQLLSAQYENGGALTAGTYQQGSVHTNVHANVHVNASANANATGPRPPPGWSMPPPDRDMGARDRNPPVFNRRDTPDLFDSYRNMYGARNANEGNRRYRDDHPRSLSPSRPVDLGQRGGKYSGFLQPYDRPVFKSAGPPESSSSEPFETPVSSDGVSSGLLESPEVSFGLARYLYGPGGFGPWEVPMASETSRVPRASRASQASRTPGPRSAHSRARAPSPQGAPKRNRFFILKSFNEGNVRKAMADGVWTTQMKNEGVLVEAFSTCRNVFLFFSVNKSRAFQGYARMQSLPSAQTFRPAWMDAIHWESTEPFRINWLNTFTTDFRHVAHFINEFNDRRSVIIGKDGQEMDEGCGRRLMEEMDSLAAERDMLGGSGRGRGRPDSYRRRSPSLASRITGGRR